MFCANFDITYIQIQNDYIRTAQIPDLQKKIGINLKDYNLENKRQILRNCVEPELGLHILNQAKGIKLNTDQLAIF